MFYENFALLIYAKSGCRRCSLLQIVNLDRLLQLPKR